MAPRPLCFLLLKAGGSRRHRWETGGRSKVSFAVRSAGPRGRQRNRLTQGVGPGVAAQVGQVMAPMGHWAAGGGAGAGAGLLGPEWDKQGRTRPPPPAALSPAPVGSERVCLSLLPSCEGWGEREGKEPPPPPSPQCSWAGGSVGPSPLAMSPSHRFLPQSPPPAPFIHNKTQRLQASKTLLFLPLVFCSPHLPCKGTPSSGVADGAGGTFTWWHLQALLLRSGCGHLRERLLQVLDQCLRL